jgi:26S proteasome regulatory subunit N4
MRALEIMKQRESMEDEMKVLIETLTAPGAPGLSGNLVDEEGFPRADINIHTIRTQRHRLACLRTDHKIASDQIEKLLLEALAPCGDDAAASSTGVAGSESHPAAASTASSATAPAASIPGSVPPRPPFAIVDEVKAGSPASTAGLLIGDAIVAFGAISLRSMATNQAAMAALPGCLREHEGREIAVAVNRGSDFVELKLTPSRWEGQGLLGCHVAVAPPAPQIDSQYAPQVAVAVATRYSSGGV